MKLNHLLDKARQMQYNMFIERNKKNTEHQGDADVVIWKLDRILLLISFPE